MSQPQPRIVLSAPRPGALKVEITYKGKTIVVMTNSLSASQAVENRLDREFPDDKQLIKGYFEPLLVRWND